MRELSRGSAVLRQVGGRAPRVALLVYNDAHNDSRVLKTAASLRAAGAEVRIFAVARRRAGYAEGPAVIGDGIEADRAPEFELVRYRPGRLALAVARRLTGRTPAAEARHPRRSTPTSRASFTITDLWLRTYRTLSLGVYWLHTARAAVCWRPEVVHANDGNTLAPALWIAQRCGAQIVYDSHELWLHRNVRSDRPVAPWAERAIEAVGIRRAAGVITVSPSIAEWLQRRYLLSQAPALVRNAPRGPSSDSLAESPAQGRLRELAGLDDGDRVIAYGGRITTARGIEETLATLTLLSDEVHFVLLGYGEPDYLVSLYTLIERLGISGRVHFVGAVAPDEVSAALADADLSVVFVRPICLSYEYSLPNKLFESIHAGVPVVAADLPDTASLVRELAVGEIFRTDHPADMASTIESVLSDPQAYRAAARAASSALTWEHEETALLNLYVEVLDR
ncbi:MAG: glycosyltransferase [Ornithinimicrobium sp.]